MPRRRRLVRLASELRTTITAIERHDRFPIDCSTFSPGCRVAIPGYTIVYLSVTLADGSPVNGGALFDAVLAADVRIVGSSGGGSDFLGVTSASDGRTDMAFANAEADTGLRLLWPGNPPVLLDR